MAMINLTSFHPTNEVLQTGRWSASCTGGGLVGELKFDILVTESDLPKPTHEILTVQTHGYEFPTPGIIKRNGTITMTFLETTKVEILKAFEKYYKDVYDHTKGTRTGAYSEFFFITTLMQEDATGDKKIATYLLNDCIITEIDFGGSFENGLSPNYYKPKMTIGYSHFIYE